MEKREGVYCIFIKDFFQQFPKFPAHTKYFKPMNTSIWADGWAGRGCAADFWQLEKELESDINTIWSELETCLFELIIMDLKISRPSQVESKKEFSILSESASIFFKSFLERQFSVDENLHTAVKLRNGLSDFCRIS